MVWQPKFFVNSTILLQPGLFDFCCLTGCAFLDLKRKRTGFPAGSSPAGLPVAGPCSVCLSLEGLKITQPWIPDRADIWPDIAMGDTFTTAVVSHKVRREERQDWKRRGDKSQGVYANAGHRFSQKTWGRDQREHIRDDVRDLRKKIDMKVLH